MSRDPCIYYSFDNTLLHSDIDGKTYVGRHCCNSPHICSDIKKFHKEYPSIELSAFCKYLYKIPTKRDI